MTTSPAPSPGPRPRVLLTRRWPASVESRFTEAFDVTLNEGDQPLSSEALRAALHEFDAVCPTVSDRLPAELFAGAGLRTRLLGNYGVGYNHIAIEAARAAGIVVTNTPDVLTDATADLAILLMLMAARRAGEGERELRAGRWTGWRPTHLLGTEVSGGTLGLVGFGRIGQAVARRAHRGFGMRILYWARRRADPESEAETGAAFMADLQELLRGSDVVSLHVPGGAATHHLIDAKALTALGPHAILINTARGDVLDEEALAAALAAGRLAGAGLDVYAREPAVAPALLACERAVLLPHLGSATQATREAMGMRVFDNVAAFFAGRDPADRVA